MWKWLTALVDKMRGKKPRAYTAQESAGNFAITGYDSMPRRLRVAFGGITVMPAAPGSFTFTPQTAALTPAQGSSPALADFNARKSGPGVIRWFDFDSAAQLGANQETSNYIETGWIPGHGTNAANPVIDTSVKASGAASLRFDLNSQTQSDGAGAWFCNFSSNLQTTFGANSEFYVQMRIRWNQAFHDTIFLDNTGSTQGGIKFFDVGAGDQVGFNGDNVDASQRFDDAGQSYTQYNTNSALEHVVNTYLQTRIVQMYAYDGTGNFQPMNEAIGGGEFKLENAMPSPFCLYSQAQTTGDVPGCFNMQPNEWVTFQLGIQLGALGTFNGRTAWNGSRVRLWMAREGQPSILVNDWRATHDDGSAVGGYYPPFPGETIYNKKFGKLNIFPYLTQKNANQVHALCQMWVDEVIISTQKIADPATSSTATNPTLTLAANTAVDLGVFTPTDPVGDVPGRSQAGLPLFSGFQYDANRRQMVLFGAGHAASNNNAIYKLSLTAAAPTWQPEYTPTPLASWTFSNYDFTKGAWLTGASVGICPAARHTLDEIVVNGDELILLGPVEGNYPNLQGDWSAAATFSLGADHYANSQARVAHYNFLSQTWAFSSTAVGMNGSTFPATSLDPSGKVLVVGQAGLQVYDPATKTSTMAINFGTTSAARNEDGTLVADGWQNVNQSLVYFPPTGKHYYLGNLGTVFAIAFNSATPSATTITKLTTSGTPPPGTSPEVNGAAYDSANGLIGVGPSNNVFYAFNPVTKAWTSKTIPQSPGSCSFHCIDYDPVNNCYVFISTGLHTWAYRYA